MLKFKDLSQEHQEWVVDHLVSEMLGEVCYGEIPKEIVDPENFKHSIFGVMRSSEVEKAPWVLATHLRTQSKAMDALKAAAVLRACTKVYEFSHNFLSFHKVKDP